MLSFASFMIFGFSLSTAVPQEQNVIETWLNERLLEPENTRHEMGRFIEARIPPLSVPETAVAWQGQSDRLRRQILDAVVFRGVPREWVEWKPEVLWGDTLQTEKGYRIRKLRYVQTEKGYRIRKLRYEALPGLWIPALLYEPIEIQGKVPAILNVNGHVGPKGKAIEYEQIRCINLAKRGMLALHPEWLVFGELEGFDYKHNRLAYLDLCGLSGLAVFYLAMRGGVDVLLDYPSTDPQRLAMTGLSGGGWQTILLSALDTRISTIVPNAGYIGLESRVVHRGDIGDLEQNPTDLVSIADYPHLTAMLAPRPALLIYNEKDDCCFVSERARPSVYDPVIPFYRLFGAEGDFEYHENRDPGTHNYDQDNRQQFYRFVHRQFFPDGEPNSDELPSDAEVLDPDQLRMGLPEANANFFTLAHERLSSLPKHPVPTNDPVALQHWQVEARSRLRDVLRLKPMAVEAETIRQALEGELEATWYKFTISGEWSVPAVVMSEGKP
ncbi:acetylxylan esterase, partial [Candidatus Poribacteria bacterium]|nr:acetylxylan esterase [Candidatus Poribacteria bacterium]